MIRPATINRSVDPRFLLDPFEPSYLALYRAGEIGARVEAGLRELEDCCACPRNCHVNRMAGEVKICHTGRYAQVASAFPHFGEEDCLRGWSQINSRLLDLMATVHNRRDETTMPLIEQAVRLHYEVVAIHPFKNGNGRWARMLANILLLQEGSTIVHWSEETIGIEGVVRTEYLETLRAADNGDFEPLIKLHIRYQEQR